MKIYFAGPLFTTAERQLNSQLKATLQRTGHQVWLPQERKPRTKTARGFFTKNLQGIDWADLVLANMDGADPDSGTCWECGYAYGRKAIVLFRTDFRTDEDPGISPYNVMPYASATIHIEKSFDTVAELSKHLKEILVSMSPVLRKNLCRSQSA